MKRKLLTFATLVCAVCFSFSLVSCGGDGNNNSDNTSNKVDTVAVTGITLSKNALTLDVGGEETLTATITPDDATDKTVTWASDHSEIAKVENGKVTALKAGTANITATAGEKSATCVVTVNAADVKMSETEWKNYVTTLAEATNFTITHTNVKRNAVICIQKNTDMKHYDIGFYRMDSDEKSDETIYEEKDGKYYCYSIVYYDTDAVANPVWAKEEITEVEYKEQLSDNFYFERDLLALTLNEYYDEFTYEGNGKYTLATATVPEEGYGLEDIEIIVDNGKFVKISLVAEYLGKLEFENFGTTTIDVVPEV